ncbi:hypothetical protein P8825_15045 [Shouchella clausii]|uniref:DUF7352 domain-containing protein n=1 Tax=Shouchella clausii TaxID=79880 RepID=UPI002DBC336D|nr:hypothetical protein [Shouchella clausii]MEB5480880.1 hypothetical protein [Shouchella clausii]
MKKIFKYALPIKGTRLLSLPKNSQVLSVGNQRRNLVLWAAVDTDAKETEQHLITIETTDNPLSNVDNADFLGTVLFDHDEYVVHVFHEKV